MRRFTRFVRALRAEPYLSVGLAGILGLSILIGGLSQLAQRALVAGEDRAAEELTTQLLAAEHVRVLVERRSSEIRTFLLTGSSVSRTAVERLDRQVRDAITALYDGAGAEPEVVHLDAVLTAYNDYQASVSAALESRDRNATPEEIELFASSEARSKRFEVDRAIDELTFSIRSRQQSAAARRQQAASLAATINVLITAAVLALAGGAVLTLWRVTQIERRRQREAEAYAERIEASNRDLDAFAGRIAHDLRNALNPISFAAASLDAMAGDPTAVRGMAAKITRFVGRAGNLIEGLLAFSRASLNAAEGGVSDVRRVCREVADEITPGAQESGVEISLDVEEGHARIHAPLLHQALANLLGNAVKFLRERPRKHVRLVGRRLTNDYVIEVSDTGPGIPRESLGRIFEPFYRVPGAPAPGTGIGLATVSRIIGAHDGGIDVRSTVGEGTTFTVRLPIATVAPALDAPAEAKSENAG